VLLPAAADDQAYGDLFQWGRGDDGHQVSTSPVHNTGLAITSVPNAGNAWDGKFILSNSSPIDWLSTQDANLWQGVNGVNNPCPPGYRLPTEDEWNAEILSWAPNNNANGAFASSLKLPAPGFRFYSNGSLLDAGALGFYWSSTVDDIFSLLSFFSFFGDDATMLDNHRALGLSVRCIKD
jgi:uncharacterized protein (TIGR02145 family)